MHNTTEAQTGASLVVTGALLVVTMCAIVSNSFLVTTSKAPVTTSSGTEALRELPKRSSATLSPCRSLEASASQFLRTSVTCKARRQTKSQLPDRTGLISPT